MGKRADKATQELVREVARDIVAGLAPDELPLFPAISESYLKDPEGAAKEAKPKDEVLAFGADPYVVMISSVALRIVWELTAQEPVRRLIKRWRPGRQTATDDQGAFTKSQLDEIRKSAYQKAKAQGVSHATATTLADSLVGILVVKRLT